MGVLIIIVGGQRMNEEEKIPAPGPRYYRTPYQNLLNVRTNISRFNLYDEQ